MSKDCVDYQDTCCSVVYQTTDVSMPMTLSPMVNVGKLKVKCCGEPDICIRHTKNACGRLELTITQTVTYKIPIEYGIDANTGDVKSSCMSDHICDD